MSHDWTADIAAVAEAASRLSDRARRLPYYQGMVVSRWLKILFLHAYYRGPELDVYERWYDVWCCVGGVGQTADRLVLRLDAEGEEELADGLRDLMDGVWAYRLTAMDRACLNAREAVAPSPAAAADGHSHPAT